MGISQKIKDRMSQLKIKPITLARETGYSPQYICELLAGEKRWNEDVLNKVCDVLQLKIQFVNDDHSIPSELPPTGTDN